MKKEIGILTAILFTILFLPVCARADSITFTSDANIQAGDTWLNVYILDTPPNHTTVTMTGGSVTDGVALYDASTFNMWNGTVSTLDAAYSSTANIFGGTLLYVSAIVGSTSTINLRGGNITQCISAGPPATINVFGYDLAKTNVGGKYNDGQISGFWQDGTPFSINLSYYTTYSRINLISIPEPATILLLTFGAAAILRLRSGQVLRKRK